MTHLRIDMSENDLSPIDMVADAVDSDTCQFLWVVRVFPVDNRPSTNKLHNFVTGEKCDI